MVWTVCLETSEINETESKVQLVCQNFAQLLAFLIGDSFANYFEIETVVDVLERLEVFSGDLHVVGVREDCKG